MSELKSVDIKGLLDTYEFPCKLPGSGDELLIKPVTTGQMKKILAYENETDPSIVEDALDRLIESCVLTEGFNINEIYLQDRFYLLMEIRKVSKGASYNFRYRCPVCGVENFKVVNLNDLNVKTFEKCDNIIKISDKLKFEVDFPTRGEQKDAVGKVKKLLNLSPHEKEAEIVLYTFANSVIKVHTPSGIVDDVAFEDKLYILNNISSGVFDEFKKWFGDNDFGLEFKTKVTCTNGDFEKDMDISLSDFFV